MNILWLCNMMLPKISESRNLKQKEYGGWLTGLSNDLLESNGISLCVCFPTKSARSIEVERAGKLQYCMIPQSSYDSFKARLQIEARLEEVMHVLKPDIIHIHGTEYAHSYVMTKVCQRLGIIDKVVVSIQGLVSVCARHYDAGLPNRVVNGFTIKELIRKNNIRQSREAFIRNGELEVRTIKNVKHIIGRTDWDRACTEQINPDAKYHFCNETLRDSFYEHSWDISKCKKRSIFISQAGYPIKGFHRVLEAMPEVVKWSPDAHVFVAGNDITKHDTLSDKLRIGSYGKYIRLLINKYNLKDNVTFLGPLNEADMCKQYLASNVFVSASSIENSPNSVGEAMILGVPTISSDVGGVKNMLTHNVEGFIYQHDAPYMLSYYIKKLFKDDNLAETLSRNARLQAKQTHSRESNLNAMRGIYEDIAR